MVEEHDVDAAGGHAVQPGGEGVGGLQIEAIVAGFEQGLLHQASIAGIVFDEKNLDAIGIHALADLGSLTMASQKSWM